jgi:hypothetical protein
MTKLLAAMLAASFGLVLNIAIAENAKSDQGKVQAQTDVTERKIGRGEGTDWAGRRIETDSENARSAPAGRNAELAMTCQGKTGRERDRYMGHAQGDEDNAGAAAKEKEGGEPYKR